MTNTALKQWHFRPAPVRGEQTVTLDTDHVKSGTEKETQAIKLADVTGVRFVQTRLGDSDFRSLTLESETAGDWTLSINAARTAGENPDTVAYEEAMGAILVALHAVSPELPVTVGQSKRLQWVLFAGGLITLAFAIGLPAAVMADGRGERLAAVIVPMGLLAVIGAALTFANWPGRKQPSRRLSSWLSANDQS